MNGNEPAFGAQDVYAHPEEILEHKGSPGLTKRELFAAMAMQGMLANESHDWDGDFYAKGAVLLADALIKRLSEPPK